MFNGERMPYDSSDHDKNMIAVPEGRFHTSEQFFYPTPEQAIREALKRVQRINDEADRILASVRQAQDHLKESNAHRRY